MATYLKLVLIILDISISEYIGDPKTGHVQISNVDMAMLKLDHSKTRLFYSLDHFIYAKPVNLAYFTLGSHIPGIR